ncbi:STAS domain-containing protein [Chromobacterium paludis]|uniref:STAS domain-containing protein n=1 Tax=Chromobacterium paludis TaxID=2605945 RepID=A0A5C1DC41_9NEIS|nr:STAS domain-containing protein [Chromobacterium paludis]QEL54214.1 STAS domain-containing protein [Chromobacterium paludis]
MTLSLFAGHEQTIFQAAQWRDELLRALQSGEDIHLDLSTLEELDSAGAQVLIWLRQEAARLGRPLVIGNPSRCVVEFAALMGMDAVLLADATEGAHGS